MSLRFVISKEVLWYWIVVAVEGELVGIALFEKFFDICTSAGLALNFAGFLWFFQMLLPFLRKTSDSIEFVRAVKDTARAYEPACVVSLIILLFPTENLGEPWWWIVPLVLMVAVFLFVGLWLVGHPSREPLNFGRVRH